MKQVLIPFTTGVEEIELITIVDILRRADVEVCMASLDGDPVSGRSRITVHADQHIKNTLNTAWDMVVLPGGMPNAQLLRESNTVQDLVCKHAHQGKTIAAICAAPVALAAFGITNNKNITSYPSFKEEMLKLQPTSTYLDNAVVEDGGIITSRGAGTSIDFALCLVSTLCGADKAKHIRTTIVA